MLDPKPPMPNPPVPNPPMPNPPVPKPQPVLGLAVERGAEVEPKPKGNPVNEGTILPDIPCNNDPDPTYLLITGNRLLSI